MILYFQSNHNNRVPIVINFDNRFYRLDKFNFISSENTIKCALYYIIFICVECITFLMLTCFITTV